MIPWMPLSYAMNNTWEGDLWLLTPAELEVTPQGTVLTSIMGNTKTVGVDEIDTDTRFGYTAFGLYSTQFEH